ncbi:MAG: hypothetical protein IK093_00300 [Ruminiclostridium sp.]|nr:hypothetical protein [Ruminiclostridium sp.]
MEFDINGFINEESPGESICREERQYAALLYEVLIRAKNGIIGNYSDIVNKILPEGARIIHVYYEATLMRDYFNCLSKEEKIEFNEMLLTKCGAYNDDFKIIEDSLGSPSKEWKKIQDSIGDKKKRFRLQYARYMMRAKPDLFVVFENDKRVYAKIIECKYTQKEGKYKDKDGRLTIGQEKVQKNILDFLFGENGLIKFEGENVYSDGVVEVNFDDETSNNGIIISKNKLISNVYKHK